MDDYDARFDARRRRRARRFENEADDAWGAAEEDDLAEPDLEIEDLAAGYEWNDPDPLLESPPRRTDSRPYIPPAPVPPVGGSYDPARGYLTQGPVSEPPFDPYRPPTRPLEPVHPPPPPQPHSLRAYCSILLLVVLGLVAFMAVILTFALVRGMLGQG